MDISDRNTLLSLQAQAEAEGRQCVVGALIRNAQGYLLVQKRAPTRKLYPDCWDIIGGHVEVGESLTTALAREIHEETGWKLARIVTLLDVCDWQAEQGACKREFDFLVEIEGDLEHPELERSKHTAFRWVDLAGLDLLKEQRLAGDDLLYQIVKRALEWGETQRCNGSLGNPTAPLLGLQKGELTDRGFTHEPLSVAAKTAPLDTQAQKIPRC